MNRLSELGERPMTIAGLLCFAAGGLYGWSAMIPALNASFTTSSAQAGLVFSLAIAVFSISLLLTPRLPVAMRGLKGAGVFGLIGSACLLVAPVVPSFELFLVAYSLGFGLASGAIYMLVLELAASAKKSRRATAFMVAAFGLGGAVFGPAQRLLVANGWGLMALWALAGVLCILSIVGLTSNNDTNPYQMPKEPPTNEQEKTNASLVKVWLLWLGFGLGSAAGLMVLGLATTIIETRGGAIWLSSVAIFGIAGGNALGRVSAGLADGWLHAKWLVPLATSLSAVGLIFTAIFTGPLLSAIGLIAVATAYGLVASSFPIITRLIVGKMAFSRTFSIVFTAWGIAGLFSPWLAGKTFDVTGSFSLALFCALAASLAALVISLVLARLMVEAG